MLRNYLIIATRSILKSRVYSLINVLGLSIGIAVSLLILLFVAHEFSYDKFHSKADRIFHMYAKVNYGGQQIQMTAMSSQFGPMALQSDEGIENYVRIRKPGRVLIKAEGKDAQFENNLFFSDSSFFNVFTFPLIRGDRKFLTEPGKVIITEKTAKKYFGDSDPIGKILMYEKTTPLEIAGVAKNAPSNSSIQFDIVASFSTLGTIASEKNQFNHAKASLGSYDTYLLLKSNVQKEKIEQTLAKVAAGSVDEKYYLDLFSDAYLSNFSGTSPTSYLYVFLTIALIILALALINYLSLTTARATLRAKEVGIRKVIGARRSNLSVQFFLESTLMTVSSFVLAFAFIQTLIPLFLQTLDIKINHEFIFSQRFISIITLLFIVCVLIAGIYPSLVLSRFAPMDVLKGKMSGRGKGAWVRKGFTVFQFTASIGLMLCAMVVYRQMEFIKQQKLGLNKEQVMVVNLSPDMAQDYNVLKNELRNQPGILKVSSASFPMYTSGTSGYFTKTPTTKEDVFINVIAVDEHFFSTLGIDWEEKPTSDYLSGKLIINKAALDKLKLTNEDWHQSLQLGRDTAQIEGIVKNFNFETLRSKVNGLVISVESDTSRDVAAQSGALYLRLKPDALLADKIQMVQNVFKKYQSDHPFEYYFLDDAFDRMYKSEDRLAKIFHALTFVAIFIACLGLLGLITFTSEVRTKEIGIRKILGASVESIVALLSKDYFYLILLSMILATPVAWWYLQNWLSGFSYRIEIPWWYTLIATSFALLISFLTTCYQSVKSAIRNPVDSLKSE